MANYGEVGNEPQIAGGLLALTGAATLAVGALLYGAGTGVLSTLTHPGSSGKYLRTSGVNTLAWSTLNSSDLTGALPAISGAALTGLTSGQVSGLTAWATKAYPADAAGVLTNDGAGNLSWAAGGGGSYLPLTGGVLSGALRIANVSGTLPTNDGTTYGFRISGNGGLHTAIDSWVSGYTIDVNYSGGTIASPSATPSSTMLALRAFGHNGTTYTSTHSASYAVSADGLWSSTNRGVYHSWEGTSNGSITRSTWMTLQGGNLSILAGRIIAATPTTSYASITLPHGVAPTSPLNGDLWTTSAGLFAQINGATVGPFLVSAGSFLPLTGGTLTGNLTVSPASGIAKVLVNAASGQTPYFSLGVNSIEQWQIYTSEGQFTLKDVVNSSYPITINPGLSTAQIVSFNGTLDATTTTNASVSILGGLGIIKSLIVGGKINGSASTTSAASLNLPHGTGPTSPVNGDLWTTASGVYARINGVTTALQASSDASTLTTGTLADARLSSNIPLLNTAKTWSATQTFADISATNLRGGFKNKIVDGNFDIWLEGTSSSSSGYGAATMWAGIQVGTTQTKSQQAFALGQTAVPYEPTYFHRSVVTSSAGAGNFSYLTQRIESVRTLAGQTATLTFYAKADAAKNIAVEVFQYFGSGGSPSAQVEAQISTVALTTGWVKQTVTITFPSISGKTLGSNGDDFVGIYFWFDAGSSFNSRTNSLGQQSGTFDIAQVQLEAGSVATPFEVLTVGETMQRVGRYYERIGFSNAELGLRGYDAAASTPFVPVQYKVIKRTAPSAAKVGTWSVGNCSQPSIQGVGVTGFTIYGTVTALGAYYFYTTDATCGITVDARL